MVLSGKIVRQLKPLLHFCVTALAPCFWTGSVCAAGVLFNEPAGGWLYSYEGAGTAFGSGADVADSLDGSWVRGGGTHHVEMFVDGAFAPVRFELTAGPGNEGGATAAMNYIGMGFSNSPQMGAVDLDYIAVTPGIFARVPEPGMGSLFSGAALLAMRRRPRRA